MFIRFDTSMCGLGEFSALQMSLLLLCQSDGRTDEQTDKIAVHIQRLHLMCHVQNNYNEHELVKLRHTFKSRT